MHKVRILVGFLGLVLICLSLLRSSNPTLAETNAHRCEVSVVDFNKDAKNKLGSFSTLIKSEKVVTKAFQFPDTD
jgi:hypothetical protein